MITPDANAVKEMLKERMFEMIKKGIAILLFIILATISCAYAVPVCPNHTKQDVYYSWETYWPDNFSPIRHAYVTYWQCNICGKTLEEKDFYEHTFSGTVCIYCGYTKPDRESLNSDALYRGDDIIDCSCWVIYKETVYSDASLNASTRGMVSEKEQYYIDSYQVNGNRVWCQIKKNAGASPIGWVRAEAISINKRPEDTHETGERVRIIVSSGKGRLGPGTEYAHVATVHYDDVYSVLDEDISSTGATWYKVRVDGKECWISSGLVDPLFH